MLPLPVSVSFPFPFRRMVFMSCTPAGMLTSSTETSSLYPSSVLTLRVTGILALAGLEVWDRLTVTEAYIVESSVALYLDGSLNPLFSRVFRSYSVLLFLSERQS